MFLVVPQFDRVDQSNQIIKIEQINQIAWTLGLSDQFKLTKFHGLYFFSLILFSIPSNITYIFKKN